MQASSATYFPNRRNIAQEIAELSRERPGITEAELKAEGFTKEEIDENVPQAAKLLRSTEDARAF